MKKQLYLLLAISGIFIFTACPFWPKKSSEVPDTSSVNLAYNLKAGWNLGNTLDACEYGNKNNMGLSTETSWGMPKTTRQMIHAIADKGFTTLRIPVSFHNHILNSSNTIDSSWLNRIKTIVDWAYEKEMYVIINIHHDNLTSNQLSSTYGYTLNTNASENEKSKKYITDIWTQLAEYFKDYDRHLIFEILNEPRNRDSSNDGFTAPENVNELNRIISSYNQSALNAIRKSGSYNEDRYIMLPYYAASPYDKKGWTLPKDSANDRLLISVHAYTPYDFCMNTSADKTFENEDEGNDISYLFTLLYDSWISKGYGIVIGETSASDKNNLSERLEWMNYFVSEARKNYCAVILWDNMTLCKESGGQGDINSGECHGYFNRSKVTWYFPSLVEKMILLSD